MGGISRLIPEAMFDYGGEGGFKSEPTLRTTQRGLEQILHDRTMAPLDKINPISPKNVKIDIYMQAARNFLRDY